MRAIDKYSPDTVYRLNPLYTMIKRNKRILLLELDPWLKSIFRYFHINPFLAVLLSLFDGTRTFSDVKQDYRWLIETDINLIEIFFEDLLKLKLAYPILLPLEAKSELALHDYQENDLLIPADEVDLKSLERYDFPTDIVMMFTNHCQVDCIYCYAERDKTIEHLASDRWCSLLDEIVAHKVPSITLAGGDPLLYPDIDIVIRHIVDNGMFPSISIKTELSKDKCKKLKDCGLERIQVSLDSGISSVADQVVASNGYFVRIMQTIQNLLEANIDVVVKSVCTSVNIDTLAPLVEQLNIIGCTKHQLVSYSRTAFRHHDSLFPSNEQIEKTIELIESWKNKYIGMEFRSNLKTYMPISNIDEKRTNWENRAECSTARKGLAILPNGSIAVCDRSPTSIAEFDLGSVSEQSIASVWRSPKLLSYLFPKRDSFIGTVCHTCDNFERCNEKLGRCVRDVYIAYSKYYAPDPKCPKSEYNLRMD